MAKEITKDREALKGIFEAILSAGKKESNALYLSVSDHPDIQKAVAAAKEGDIEAFNYLLAGKFDDLVDGLLNVELVDSASIKFIFRQYDFVERSFKVLFERAEGMACCADKSRTVMRHLLRHFMTGKDIQLDYTQEYTYHLPEKIFRTHDEIIGFFDALHRLHFGNPDPYLKALKLVVGKTNEPKPQGIPNV